jgi:hypothetical protein
VKSEACVANLENGVLRLRLPKISTSTRQRIPVQASRAAQAEQANQGAQSDQASGPTEQPGTS